MCPVLSSLLLRRSELDGAGRRGRGRRAAGRARVRRRPGTSSTASPASRCTGACSPWPGAGPTADADGRCWPASSAAVLVEGVNDHENLGAIFRNAAALGAGAVLLDPTCCDPLYRRSVRVSVGHVLRVPFARLAPWPAASPTWFRPASRSSPSIRAPRTASSPWPRCLPGDGWRCWSARRARAHRGGPGRVHPSGPHPDGARGGFAQRGHRRGDRPAPPGPSGESLPDTAGGGAIGPDRDALRVCA